jgi:hypothetical protein
MIMECFDYVCILLFAIKEIKVLLYTYQRCRKTTSPNWPACTCNGFLFLYARFGMQICS